MNTRCMTSDATARSIVERLQESGYTAYYAGGCVRDRLLQRESKDVDIATSATPDEVIRLFPRTTGIEGKSFGVVRVLEKQHTFEIATFREDLNYSDGRRPNAVRFVTAEQDAQRRDFTVNGLFYDPITNRVMDYVRGQEDLQQRLLRAIGNPSDRFREDKLRLLRAIRFAVVLDFTIEPTTWAAVCEHAAEIRQISPERIREELNKILTSGAPARGLDLLDASGLLQYILPEIHAMHGVEQPPQFHPEGDVFKHTRLMLSHLQGAPLELALSVLLHDVGKPKTATVDATGRIRFNEHEYVGARMAEKILRRLRYSNETIEHVVACVQNHMAFKDTPHMRLSKLKRFLARPTLPTELELHRVDCLSSHGDLSILEFLQQKIRELPEEEIAPEPLVNGRDLMVLGLKAGPTMGKILNEIREAQLNNAIHTREEALAEAARLMANLEEPQKETSGANERCPPHLLKKR